MNGRLQPPRGHVFRVDRTRGPGWSARYRLPDGHQPQRKIGPAWIERGRPPAGSYTKRTDEEWLRAPHADGIWQHGPLKDGPLRAARGPASQQEVWK